MEDDMTKERKIITCVSHLNKYPYVQINNSSDLPDDVCITIWLGKERGHRIHMSRSMARITAKRINQFLDYTLKNS
jgi:hypothetical protein